MLARTVPGMLVLFALVLLALAPALFAADAPPDQIPQKVNDGNREFALSLYQKLAAKPGNLFFSPYSISSAMAMTATGAAGQTRADLLKGLDLPDDFAAAFAKLNAGLKPDAKGQSFTINLANALWVQQGDALLPKFVGGLKDDFNADAEALNFSDPAAASDKINAWVKQQTEGKIDSLVSPDGLNGIRMVLTNAIYFKANWADEFEKGSTRPEDFSIDGKTGAAVPMMHHNKRYAYLENDRFQALSIPYSGGKVTMLVVLPKKADGLGDLEQQKDASKLLPPLSQLEMRDVQLSLPKFKIKQTLKLKDALSEMGMAIAFDANRADFSGMTGAKDLFIGAVLHQAFVDVDEQGTEAAAATAVMMAPTAMRRPPEEPVVFKADHPFLFAIEDMHTGAILFMGRVDDPR